MGVDTVFFDLDNTLMPRDTAVISGEIRNWLDELVSRGFKPCLVSNNWHGHVAEIAKDLGMPIVAKAIKPLPFAFLKALKVTGAQRTQAAIVGDQLFTDVLGGKLVGIKTVLVVPLSASDLPHTLFLRKLERVLLAGRQPLP
jgi:HAD superfamily phosphatase (TIGR01668 family)